MLPTMMFIIKTKTSYGIPFMDNDEISSEIHFIKIQYFKQSSSEIQFVRI